MLGTPSSVTKTSTLFVLGALSGVQENWPLYNFTLPSPRSESVLRFRSWTWGPKMLRKKRLDPRLY